jgi:alkanesulfonate monooxygenase SsuD/methylene tetrahydromethanopterin reductase-like flavin-dependent oxidoreductase (luciferase family)
VGWLKKEIEACGAAFDSRGRRADEQLEILRALWADREDGVTHHGEFFDFDYNNFSFMDATLMMFISQFCNPVFPP